MTTPATDRQKDYLRALAGYKFIFGEEHGPVETLAMVNQRIARGLTQSDASDLIGKAQAAAFVPREQIPASAQDYRRLLAVAETGAVFGLGVSREDTIARVEAMAEAGGMTQSEVRALVSAGYRTPHPDGKGPLPLAAVEGLAGVSVHEGHFAVMFEDVLRFYRVYSPTNGAYRGQPVIRRYSSNIERPITPAEAVAVIETINADWDAAAFRFADEFTCCYVCGRQLTDQVSRLVSVGPTCRGFSDHGGLRAAAADVDVNPARRAVFRALREWAVSRGLRDPQSREQRVAMKNVTASALASAWSGIPGVIDLPVAEALDRCKAAVSGEGIDPDLLAGMLIAPADTLLLLMQFRVLSAPALEALVEHPNRKVSNAAKEYFLGLLA